MKKYLVEANINNGRYDWKPSVPVWIEGTNFATIAQRAVKRVVKMFRNAGHNERIKGISLKINPPISIEKK